MRRIKITDKTKQEAILEAVSILRNGGLVIFPTETAYGIAARATDENAVSKLLTYKERPEGKAISIAVTDEAMAAVYVEANAEAKNLYKRFLPGPMTVISNSKHIADTRLEAEKGTLGIRIPDYEFTLDLIRALGEPITATSANRAGRKTPYSIEDVIDNNSQKSMDMVDLALDVGELEHNPPSTVVDTTTTSMQVIRKVERDMSEDLVITTPEDMVALGKRTIADQLEELEEKTILFLFNGDLGAGKTQFTKGVAQGLGITEIVSSPTYTIMNEYEFMLRSKKQILYHIDGWRMEQVNELDALNLTELIRSGDVVALEWSGGSDTWVKAIKKALSDRNVELVSIDVAIDYLDADTRSVRVFNSNK